MNMYAVGSYSKQLVIYDELVQEAIASFEGHKGGVTHLAFSSDGSKLYSGGRKDPEILCWDIRNLDRILTVMPRNVQTNQRIFFDINPDGKHLASGNSSGAVSVWELREYEDGMEKEVLPSIEFQAHQDCVNGVSFHPTLPILATTSGQRIYPIIADDEDELFTMSNTPYENSLKLVDT
jgi:WD40 repeat protein